MPLKTKILAYIFDSNWQQAQSNWQYYLKPFILLLRYIYVLSHDIGQGQLSLRAMSLVYTTLMALVPLIAVGFSVLKAFGVHVKQLEPLLLQFLAPMGAQGKEITDNIIGFIDKVNISVLGAVGLLFLLYNAVSLLQKIESTFNYIWRLHQSRSIGRRISDYLTALLVGPTMLFFALGISASILSASVVSNASNNEVIAYGVSAIKQLVPYLIMIGAFSFFYIFIPNTKVKFSSGVIAGIVAGILWQTIGWLFGRFVVSATDSSTYAVYSGFAILILFMLWMYISWLILLIGGSLAFYIQHPECVKLDNKNHDNSSSELLRLALLFIIDIVNCFYKNQRFVDIEQRCRQLEVDIISAQLLLQQLAQFGLIYECDDGAYMLACPAEQTSVLRVFECVYNLNASGVDGMQQAGEIGARIIALEQQIKQLLHAEFANLNLKQLAEVGNL